MLGFILKQYYGIRVREFDKTRNCKQAPFKDYFNTYLSTPWWVVYSDSTEIAVNNSFSKTHTHCATAQYFCQLISVCV